MKNSFLPEPQWKVQPGMGYGLRHPVMIGSVRVTLPHAIDLQALDMVMAELLRTTVPEARDTGTSSVLGLAGRWLYWTAAVQRLSKVPVFGMGRIVGATPHGPEDPALVRVAMPYATAEASAESLKWVARVLHEIAAVGSVSPDARLQLEQLHATLSRSSRKGTNMYHFLKAAHDRELPLRELTADVYLLGYGRGSRWLQSSFTDATPAIGAGLSKDKMLTAQVIRQAGLPAPVHARANSVERALQVAERLGYPVVVKPSNLDQGVGVAANLRDAEAVTSAFHEAAKHSRAILVEKHFQGSDYRLTVVHGQVAQIVQRMPGGVTGDGVRTVRELLDAARQEPDNLRRARERGKDLLAMDAEAQAMLAEAGLTQDSIPQAAEFVCLRRRSNISAGGSSRLVPVESAHPDNRRLACRAAQALRLDIAGIDLLIQDIGRSWLETGALVCEVNGQPQIGASLDGRIHADILKTLMAGYRRMPVVLVVGDMAPGDSQWLDLCSRAQGVVGLSTRGGVWEMQDAVCGPQKSGFAAARILLGSASLDAAVIVMTPEDIQEAGLPFDRCDLALLASHTAPAWTASALAEMWRMVLPHVGRTVVAPYGLREFMPGPDELAQHGLQALVFDTAGRCFEEAANCLQGN